MNSYENYKIGDKFRVVNGINDGYRDNGQIYTVSELKSDHVRTHECTQSMFSHFYFDEIEPVTEEDNVSKFKVGDKVKIINVSSGAPSSIIQEEGKIIGIGGSSRPFRVILDKNGVVWWFKEKDLELIEPSSEYLTPGEAAKVFLNGGALIDSKGHVWSYTSEGNVSLYRFKKNKFKIYTGPKPLKVNSLDYEVVLNKDGSATVGCQEISKEDVEKIVDYLSKGDKSE